MTVIPAGGRKLGPPTVNVCRVNNRGHQCVRFSAALAERISERFLRLDVALNLCKIFFTPTNEDSHHLVTSTGKSKLIWLGKEGRKVFAAVQPGHYAVTPHGTKRFSIRFEKNG